MERQCFCVCFVLVAFVSFTISANLPSTFKKCKRNDSNFNDCLKVALQDAVVLLKDGLPEFGIYPLEPLKVDAISIEQDKNMPVRLDQKYNNVKLYGIPDSKITKYESHLEEDYLYSESITPKLVMTGDYELNGQVLLFPVKGKGPCNITMVDLVTTQKLVFERFEKKGKQYIRAKEFQLTFEPKRAYLNFENLFNGDKVLSSRIHQIVDDNWQTVFNDFKGGYEKSFGLVFKEIANQIFDRIPFETLFPSN